MVKSNALNIPSRKKRPFNKGIFAIPYMVILVLFVILPLLLVVFYAFKDVDGNFSFENIITVLTTPSYYKLLLSTILIALITTAICLVIAYPIALVLASSRFNKHAILALLFIVPMWMNFVLRMYALNSLLTLLGIGASYLAAVIGLVYDFLPFMLLPIYTILVNMDKSYIEASNDLGCNGVRTFMRVTLPLSVPGIVSGIMMVFMPVFSAYAITGMLGDPSSSVIGGMINSLIANNLYGTGSALALILLVLVILTMFIGSLMSRNKSKANTAKSIGNIGGNIL